VTEKVSAMEQLAVKVGQYIEKHDLNQEEQDQLVKQLQFDMVAYGEAHLDMEKGRIKPGKHNCRNNPNR